jgi:hypothetical protein
MELYSKKWTLLWKNGNKNRHLWWENDFINFFKQLKWWLLWNSDRQSYQDFSNIIMLNTLIDSQCLLWINSYGSSQFNWSQLLPSIRNMPIRYYGFSIEYWRLLYFEYREWITWIRSVLWFWYFWVKIPL